MKDAPKESKSEKEEDAQEKKWMAESDLRTLIEAEKIKQSPDRIKAAMAQYSEMKKAITAIKST